MEHLYIEGEEDELEILVDERQITNDVVGASYVLVGRFLTDRPVRFHMMKEKMAEFWRPVCKVSIKEVEPNLYLFQFFHPRDMERVIKQGPWSFDGRTLILGLLQQGTTPKSVPLNHVPFWVQVHDVPVGCMSLAAGKQLGNFIGEFMEYDEKNNTNFLATFMRIRVLIDVRKPLMRFKKIKTKIGLHTVRFKYERLGSFCYYCGLLGHTDDFCSTLFANPTDDGTRMWSSDLRAQIKRNNNGGYGSKWLREDEGPVRTAGATQNPGNITKANVSDGGNSQQSKPPIIVNKLGEKISLAKAFTNPSTLFPQVSRKENKEVHEHVVNEAELMEEELDDTLKKRPRCNNDNSEVITDDAVKTPQGSTTISMEGVQLTVQKQTTVDTQHFLSAESGSQTCRTK
jgi:hypothetical protein